MASSVCPNGRTSSFIGGGPVLTCSDGLAVRDGATTANRRASVTATSRVAGNRSVRRSTATTCGRGGVLTTRFALSVIIS